METGTIHVRHRYFGVTIYDSPLDFPGRVVLRGWNIQGEKFGEAFEFPDISTARRWCLNNGFDACICRDPSDATSIVESWV